MVHKVTAQQIPRTNSSVRVHTALQREGRLLRVEGRGRALEALGGLQGRRAAPSRESMCSTSGASRLPLQLSVRLSPGKNTLPSPLGSLSVN